MLYIFLRDTERFTDLDKPTLLWWFGFRLEPISTTAPAALKMMLASKGVRGNSKSINLASLVEMRDTLCKM